jgi:trans-aconitate 2-methyltransferase
MNASPTDVSDFYDNFVDCQTAAGVNERHHAVLRRLRRAGLRPDHRILEIGCGIGTLTELLAGALAPPGAVVALDLSPKSIEVAEQRLAGLENVRLIAADVLDVKIEGRFDVVVLPDVIEHIPLGHHRALFARVSSWLGPEGFVLLNYPNPHYLAWCHEHQPEVLQVIDQPVHADLLLGNVYSNGLYLDSLETYSIWIQEGDYVSAVLRPNAAARTFTPLADPRRSLSQRVAGRVRRLLR